MLTVIRAMADAVAERRAQWQRERLDPDATDAEQNALLAEMLATALFAGEEAVRHTPEQLDVLAEAGVVDAGALGLVVIIRGMIAGLAGEQVQLPEIPHYAAARLDQVHHADSALPLLHQLHRHRRRASTATRSSASSSGSATRCSSSATRRRSRSTSTPTTPTRRRRCSTAPARSSHEDIADMHEQVAGPARAARRRRARASSRSPAATGCGRCSRRSARSCVDGGPTLNPSTKDLLAAIEDCAGRRGRWCCRTRATCIMAAEEAARLAAQVGPQGRRRRRRSPSRPALAALVEFDPDGDAADERRAAARRASPASGSAPSPRRRATTPRGASAAATRSASPATEIVAWGGAGSTLVETRRRARRRGRDRHRDRGRRGADPARRARARRSRTAPSSSCSRGGTPNYSWLIAAQ